MLMIKLVDARKGLHEKCVELFHNEKVAESIYMYLCDGLEECDVVEPERKKGEWKGVYAETDYRNAWIEFSCECCEYQHGLESGEYGWYYGDEIPWKYCPICGADMRGENNDD